MDPVRFKIEYVDSPSGFLSSKVVFVSVNDRSIRAFASRRHKKIFVNVTTDSLTL
ncbi:MAG: hypothetical protein QXI64_10275 [Sulfolobales archaeon]